MGKKLLIVSESHLVKTFVVRTLQKLQDENCQTQMDCLITAIKNPSDIDAIKPYFNNIFVLEPASKWYHRIPKLRVLIQLLRLINLGSKLPKYDYVHFQFMHYYYAFLVLLFSLKSKFIYLTFYGSDFNQVGKLRHFFNRISCAFAHVLIAENQIFLDQVRSKYDPKHKIKAVQLIPLMPVMENMFKEYPSQNRSKAKQYLGFNENDIVITCGYCGDEIMQFDLMIESIKAINTSQLPADTAIQLVFPMTYGRDFVQNQIVVEAALNQIQFPYKIYKNYLSNEEVTALRFATDVFVLVSKRDQAASALYEHLLAGSIVITGKWLPYENIDQLGMNYHRIESGQLSERLNEVLLHLHVEQKLASLNYSIVKNLVSWEVNQPVWLNLYTK